MEQWKIEMINKIMESENGIVSTIANIVTSNYSEEDVYLDELSTEIVSYDSAKAEELKDYLDNDTIDIKEL